MCITQSPLVSWYTVFVQIVRCSFRCSSLLFNYSEYNVLIPNSFTAILAQFYQLQLHGWRSLLYYRSDVCLLPIFYNLETLVSLRRGCSTFSGHTGRLAPAHYLCAVCLFGSGVNLSLSYKRAYSLHPAFWAGLWVCAFGTSLCICRSQGLEP